MATCTKLTDRADGTIDVSIDGTVRFALTWEQATNLKDALERRIAKRAHEIECRDAWNVIARNNCQNVTADGQQIIGTQKSHKGGMIVVVSRALELTPGEFVSCLKESDRARATQFLRENGCT